MAIAEQTRTLTPIQVTKLIEKISFSPFIGGSSHSNGFHVTYEVTHKEKRVAVKAKYTNLNYGKGVVTLSMISLGEGETVTPLAPQKRFELFRVIRSFK